jgi:hypothetical protein
MWMTAGVLTWLHDLAAVVRGEIRETNWATPIGAGALGLFVLAVLVTGWRFQAGRTLSWRWTNVAGWLLGLFWIGMGLAALARVVGTGAGRTGLFL